MHIYLLRKFIDSGAVNREEQEPDREHTSGGESEKKNYLEIGCGVGNTVFPILEYNTEPGLFVYCCDFSRNAVDILKSHSDYNPNRSFLFICTL